MTRYKLIGMANAKPGREDEFRIWYANQHMPDVMAVPGMVSCELLENISPKGRWLFSNLYEVESDDISATMAELYRRIGTDQMPMTDAADDDSTYAEVFRPRCARPQSSGSALADEPAGRRVPDGEAAPDRGPERPASSRPLGRASVANRQSRLRNMSAS